MALSETPADDAHAALIALHGIGPWTADIYLLFCLGHGDAWPAGDLAIQEAIKLAFDLKARPTVKQMAVIGDLWRPWRGAAAHLFWAYYKIAKAPGFEAAPPAGTGHHAKNVGAAKGTSTRRVALAQKRRGQSPVRKPKSRRQA